MAQKPQVGGRQPARPAAQAQRPPAQPARPAPRPAPQQTQQRPPAQARPAPQPGRAVAHRQTTEVSRPEDNVPDFMRQYAGQGTENIGQGDIETPRIKLIQATSPEIELFEDARPGHFWHTAAQMDLGQELIVVPVYTDMRAILWRPRENGGGILARSDDNITWNPPNATFEVQLDKKDGGHRVTWRTAPTVAASGLLNWGTQNPNDPQSPPAATKMYNIVCAMPNFPELPPSVVTLQRSAIKIGRKLMANLKIVRAPSYGVKLSMGSVRDQNNSGDSYHNYLFRPAGFVEDPDDFATYQQFYEAFRAMGLTIHDIEGLQPEDVDQGAGDTGQDNGRPNY